MPCWRNLLESKISAYLGFAEKSKGIIFGIDNLKNFRKKIHLIILCNSANDKYFQVAKNTQTFNKNCTILKTEIISLSELLHKDNCKIIGIRSQNLSQAIIDNKSNILTEVN